MDQVPSSSSPGRPARSLVDRLRMGGLSRRQFMRAVGAPGIGAAASFVATPVAAQDMTPHATPAEDAAVGSLHTPGIVGKKEAAVLTNMSSDWHGFYGGSAAFDSTEKASGSASLRIDIPAGTQAGARLNLPAPTDLSAHAVKIRFRMTSWTDLTELHILLFSDAASTTGYGLNLRSFFANPKPYDWIEIAFPRSAFSALDAGADWATIRTAFVRATASAPTSVWIDDIALVPDAEQAVVSMTFDDGYQSTLDVGAAVLSAHGFRGTAFIVPIDLNRPGFMTDADVVALHRLGWGIGGHHNQSLGAVPTMEGMEEAVRSARAYLAVHGFRGGDHFAYPNGYYNAQVQNVVRKYFSTARSIDGFNQPLNYIVEGNVNSREINGQMAPATIIGWIDEAIRNKEWLNLNWHDFAETSADEIVYPTAGFERVVEYLAATGVHVRPYHEIVNSIAPLRQLRSPDGSFWTITVDNNGVLSTAKVS